MRPRWRTSQVYRGIGYLPSQLKDDQRSSQSTTFTITQKVVYHDSIEPRQPLPVFLPSYLTGQPFSFQRQTHVLMKEQQCRLGIVLSLIKISIIRGTRQKSHSQTVTLDISQSTCMDDACLDCCFAYPWQLWYDDTQQSHHVQSEVGQVVVGIVRAYKEEADGHAQEVFLGRGELFAIIHLFPHVEVVVCPSIELERDASDPMEHQIRAEHVREVGEKPRGVALDARDNAVEYFESDDEDDMDYPGTYNRKNDQSKYSADWAGQELSAYLLRSPNSR